MGASHRASYQIFAVYAAGLCGNDFKDAMGMPLPTDLRRLMRRAPDL